MILPTTFNDALIVVELFNGVGPETFKVDTNVEGLLKLTNVGGFVIALEYKFVNAVPAPIIIPTIFKEDKNVVAP